MSLLSGMTPEQRLPLILFLLYDKCTEKLSLEMRAMAEEAISTAWFRALNQRSTSVSPDNADNSFAASYSGEPGPELVLTSTLPNEDLSDGDSSEDVSDWVD